ncbi:MAG TPA: NDP-sugar synthase [Actinomycetota bacterium]|nr:NDP-sugar synthase [Actinomycetota bacterium]
MKAVVLVGGEGTRLRPITETIPKPLVWLMDRPSLDHVLDHLARHGVHEVVLSSSYLESTFHAFIEARHGDPRITWITEARPLGTGGAIVSALDLLGDEPFLALNGDILTDLDLTAMVALHRARGAAATIALHHVEDARPFGLVPTDAEGRVLEFREKPAEPIPGDVNAGTYVLDPAVLRPWPSGANISIEREIFPALIAAGHPVHGFLSDAYWLDLGTPAQYLQAHFDLLQGRLRGSSYPSPFVAEGAKVDRRAHLGRWVVIGRGAEVGPDAEIDDSVLHPNAVVEAGARVVGSILGPRARVGAGATVADCALAEAAAVEPGATLRGERVSAGRRVGGSSGDPARPM